MRSAASSQQNCVSLATYSKNHYTAPPRRWSRLLLMFFFFQAEDGIRDYKVTGVQTCALPILSLRLVPDQKLKAVERQLTAAVRRLAPKHVQASVKFLHGADPATVKVTHPAFKLLDQAFREVVGRGTVRSEERRVGKECRSRWS